MSLNQQVIAEFSPCTPSAPQLRDLSIQTFRPSELDCQCVIAEEATMQQLVLCSVARTEVK
jgi:hypothetical protein